MRKAARPHAIRKTSGPETRVSLGVALCEIMEVYASFGEPRLMPRVLHAF